MTEQLLFEKTFDLLDKTGLNWTVNKLPLFSGTGLKTQSFGIFRNDNEDWLGTVGNRYEIMQNKDLAETLVKAAEGIDIKMDRGGMLGRGEKVFLQAELPDEYIGKSNVKRLITALSSHDGSSSIGFGSSNTVVVCQNTFYRAYGELQKFRHTESAARRIELAMHDLRVTMNYDDRLMTNFKKMADVQLEDDIVARVMKKIFDVDMDKDTKDLSTRKQNQIRALGISTQKSQYEQGKTVWALFNGVTHYTTHVATKPENRQEYIMTGGGYKTNNIAFDTIMKWIEEREEDKVLVTV